MDSNDYLLPYYFTASMVAAAVEVQQHFEDHDASWYGCRRHGPSLGTHSPSSIQIRAPQEAAPVAWIKGRQRSQISAVLRVS